MLHDEGNYTNEPFWILNRRSPPPRTNNLSFGVQKPTEAFMLKRDEDNKIKGNYFILFLFAFYLRCSVCSTSYIELPLSLPNPLPSMPIGNWDFFASPVLFMSTQQIKITIEHIKFHWHAWCMCRRPPMPCVESFRFGWFKCDRAVRMVINFKIEFLSIF